MGGRFSVLLAALFLVFLVNPVLSTLEFPGARHVLSIFLSLVFLASVYAVSENRRRGIVVVALVLPALLLNWAHEFSPGHGTALVRYVTALVFLSVVTYSLLVHVLRNEAVSFEKISAALCVYLLIGVIWAECFAVIHELAPGSFNLKAATQSDFIYYSFITLSTLGYGDITPQTPPARAFAYVEAIVGQFYLTVLVARLVALQITHSSTKKGSPAG